MINDVRCNYEKRLVSVTLRHKISSCWKRKKDGKDETNKFFLIRNKKEYTRSRNIKTNNTNVTKEN